MKSKITRLGKGAVVLLALPLLSACGTMNPEPGVVDGSLPRNDGFLTASVVPGKSASCSGTPCQIYYKTPDLGGDVTVLANAFTVGSFPSNTVVRLGDYSETTVRISVKGSSNTPVAYVHMPNDTR